MANEYVFIDEWDVDAPQEAVFDALADARTYPEWWTPGLHRRSTRDGAAGGRAASRSRSSRAGSPTT